MPLSHYETSPPQLPQAHPDPSDGVDFRASDDAVEAEQIRLLLQNPADVPANLINTGLVALIVWPLYPMWAMALWLGAVCIVSLTRAVLRHRYAQATGDARTSRNWARVFTLNVFVAGCLWGLTASAILRTPDPIYYNFIVFVLGGTMAGGIVCIAVNLRAMLAFILPTILPAIVALAAHGGRVQIEMAVMLTLFTLALAWTGRSINRSITENVRLRFAQEALVMKLRSSEAAMAASQAMAHIGTWVIDLQSKQDVWSAETYRIFGVDPAAFKPSFEAIFARTHPEDRQALSEDYATLRATGTSRGIDHRIVMNDGAIKHVHELGETMRDASGRPVQLIGTVQDVTERMRGQAASALLAAVVNCSDDAIISETVTGTILSWNKGAEHLLGYPAEEAIGKNVRMIVPAERRKEIELNLAMLANDRAIDPFDTERLRRDGTRVPVSIAVSLIRDAAQAVVGASFIARDISERRAAADALAYRDRLSQAVTVGTGMLVKAQSLDLGMPEALRVVGASLRVDRVYVLQALAGQAPPMALRHCWEVPGIQMSLRGIKLPVEQLQAVFVASFESLSQGEPVFRQLATSEGLIRALFERLGTKSTLAVPIFVSGVLWGALTAEACIAVRQWSTSEIETLRTFADIGAALMQRTEAQHSLETSEAAFRAVTATAQDAIVTIDGAARIGLWNRSAERILGYTAAEASGRQVHELLAPKRFRAKADSSMDAFLLTGTGDAVDKTTELVALRKDGTEITVELSLAAARLGDAWGAIGVLRDITERKRVEALTLRMARYDVLTGLANRAVFVEALEHAIARAKRREKSFAVLYLDLDHFKDVNDTLGHPVGDELLKAVAARLRANTRATDTVARFGGDEFAIIVADIRDPADAAILADKLIVGFAIPFSVQGSDIHSGASIGIAAYGPEASDAETLLAHADVALYRAKSEGRGGYRFFTDAMDTEVQTRVTLGAELRIAVDEGQLFLMYQPQVAIDSGRITGMEALVRWQHPKRGVLGPGLFIPIAEQIGIIAKLGHWVLWEACRQGRAWLDAGIKLGRICVNVSALQFRTPVALEADITAALAQTGFPSQMLELELTETVLMDASREHSDLLQRLRKTGVTVAIDDFGTGYSSLEYLRRFPTNRIKIAQNFVSNLETTPGDAAIIRATIGLARELKIEVIAEGVETPAQRDLLKNWGCGEVQGFLFAKPLTAADAEVALRGGKISPPPVGIAEAGKA